ncbi:hypothetical protein BDV06DRAFT_197590 [Aspergillus oleicola]
MCHVIELTPQMNASLAAVAFSPPQSDYETGDEGDDEADEADDDYDHLTSSSCPHQNQDPSSTHPAKKNSGHPVVQGSSRPTPDLMDPIATLAMRLNSTRMMVNCRWATSTSTSSRCTRQMRIMPARGSLPGTPEALSRFWRVVRRSGRR